MRDWARVLSIAFLFLIPTARAEDEAQAPAALPPARSAEAERAEQAERAKRAEAEKAAKTQGSDCQLCNEGASGLELAIPLWLPIVGLSGEGTEGDSTQRVLFEPQLKFALVAEFRLRLGPVGIGLTANGASLGSQVVESETGESLGTVNLAAYAGRVTLDWYIPPVHFSGGSRTELLAIWPYLGARYALLDGDGSSASGTLIFDGHTSWGEPLTGLNLLLDLRRGWLFRLESDVGGFTLGSDIAVTANLEARYALTDWLNFRLGYRLYYSRFSADWGTGSFLLQGPGIGFGIPLF